MFRLASFTARERKELQRTRAGSPWARSAFAAESKGDGRVWRSAVRAAVPAVKCPGGTNGGHRGGLLHPRARKRSGLGPGADPAGSERWSRKPVHGAGPRRPLLARPGLAP